MTTKTTSRRNPGTRGKSRASAPPAELASAAAAGGLWGEVITWQAGGEQPYRAVVAALASSGLDETVAREMLPRHAFARACRELGRERVINLIDETAGELEFQFNRQAFDKDSKEYTFPLEAKLRLSKETGDVHATSAELQLAAKDLLDRKIATRTPGDIGQVVQRLFDREGGAFPDLYPIRPQGGAYFVPARYADFVGRVERFLGELGGLVHRFPVPRGVPAGDRSVSEIVANGIRGVVEGYARDVAELKFNARDRGWEARADRIRLAREKVEVLKEYLAGQTDALDAALQRVDGALKEKFAKAQRARAAVEGGFWAECESCGLPRAWEWGDAESGSGRFVCSECGHDNAVEW
jgi:hypothetical protein